MSFVNTLGVWLCGFGLSASFHLYILSLPGVSFGLWPQSESAVVALDGLAMVCALGMLLIHTQTRIVSYLFRHPLVLIPFLIGLLSLALLPFHEFPLRSVLGSVRTGEGTMWWFDVSVMSAAAMLLWRLKFWRRVLIFMAIAGFGVSYAMSISYNFTGHDMTPYYFSDYLAFPIIALMPVFYMWSLKHFKKPVALAIFYIVFDMLLFFTNNKALIAFGFVVPPLFFLLWSLPRFDEKIKMRFGFVLVTLLPVVTLIFMLGLAKFPFAHGFYYFADTGFFHTIASRAYLMDVAIQPLQTHPLRWLTGSGWGLFEEHIIRYLPLQWINITNEQQVQWDALTTDHFHSHNIFLETLSALGIFGFVLIFVFFLGFIFCSRSSWRLPTIIMSGGFVAWASLWFWLPLHLPFLAFAAASTARMRFIKTKIPGYVVFALLTGTIGLQFAASILIYSTARNTDHYDAAGLTPAQAIHECTMDYEDYGTNGLHLSRLMLDRVRYTTSLYTEGSMDDKKSQVQKHLTSLNHLFCQSQHYESGHHAGQRLKLTQILTRGEILLRLDEILDPETHDFYYKGWKEDLTTWLITNPQRTDQAVPYLLWHVIHEQESSAQDITEMIYRRNPNDPVGAWFKGLYMLGQGQNQQGLSLMRQALDNGIERVMVVEPEIKGMLERGL